MAATYELTCDHPDAPVAVDVFECETLDEFAEELRELASSCKGSLIVDLRPRSRPPFSIPEAMLVLVRELADAPASLTVRCILASEAARSAVVRCLPKAQRPSLVARRGGVEVELECGSIVDARVDAIVNASNTRLQLGGGVSGAIRAASRAPDALQAAMTRLAPIEVGHASQGFT